MTLNADLTARFNGYTTNGFVKFSSSNGMRPILDNYISAHYKEIRKYTNYFLVRMKSTISADAVINNSFLYLKIVKDPTFKLFSGTKSDKIAYDSKILRICFTKIADLYLKFVSETREYKIPR